MLLNVRTNYDISLFITNTPVLYLEIRSFNSFIFIRIILSIVISAYYIIIVGLFQTTRCFGHVSLLFYYLINIKLDKLLSPLSLFF